MSFFDFLKSPDINQELKKYDATAGAVLIDVRTPQEYQTGHIPGSSNVPLQSIGDVDRIAGQKETPIFVYCHSGSRSRQAATLLGKMGYTQVNNLGGISAYTGKVVR